MYIYIYIYIHIYTYINKYICVNPNPDLPACVRACRRWKEEPEAFELEGGFKPVHDLWERASKVWAVLRSDDATAGPSIYV